MKRYGLSADVVLARFVSGIEGGTAAAPVPGGRRVSAAHESGGLVLYSYRTAQAVRLPGGRIAVTPKKYSVTTSKMVSRLLTRMRQRGYEPTDETLNVHAAVPGRHGGFGLPWHPTGYDVLPFTIWAKTTA